MKPTNALNSAEATEAQRQAVRGAGISAVKWGFASAVLGGIAYAASPVYRGLTIQFKVYIQMSGMILGGMLGADRAVQDYEARLRLQRQIARDRAMWETFEREYKEEGGAPPPPRPKHLREDN
ncbi:hypothetical protein BKA67DRAFT_660875 [Truncatella angustata]|uniref:Imidazoleglycerol-phosphate dehydratase n=1 Tax=Truncatella angustata TaxID=152316 RepID=A0A9P8UH56_9PEZI|nr:uncharacterized protein BKA67DRAFT_660875 [Truncatella angustata]KAH6652105.1 hypothetical protein BKA67DRAFT_660875 [Truncatella angustata]KAH8205019.1 hypothetical protein TruAng_000742 [Truncatella angustata]